MKLVLRFIRCLKYGLIANILFGSWVSTMVWADNSQSTQNHEQKTTYHAPYPFTADELWESILKITASPNDNIKKDHIEKIFNTSLLPVINPNTNDIINAVYGTIAKKDWYFNLGSLSGHIFTFSWGDYPSFRSGQVEPPEGMCINVNSVRSSLENQGWNYVNVWPGPDGLIINIKEYSEGKSRKLALSYNLKTNCMTEVYLSYS